MLILSECCTEKGYCQIEEAEIIESLFKLADMNILNISVPVNYIVKGKLNFLSTNCNIFVCIV